MSLCLLLWEGGKGPLLGLPAHRPPTPHPPSLEALLGEGWREQAILLVRDPFALPWRALGAPRPPPPPLPWALGDMVRRVEAHPDG